MLVIEDDASLRETLSAMLEMAGYTVRVVPDGINLAGLLTEFRPDIVGLDVYLPDGPDGFELAAMVRASTEAPILFMTAADAVADRLRGFELGADDYIVKPFSIAELLARVRAVLRRANRLVSATWEIRDIAVDEENRTVVRAGRALDLSTTEFDLLCTLARTPGKIFSKTQLLSQIWGFDSYDPNVVEVCMSSVRRKLEACGPRLIFTQRGRGYFIPR